MDGATWSCEFVRTVLPADALIRLYGGGSEVRVRFWVLRKKSKQNGK